MQVESHFIFTNKHITKHITEAYGEIISNNYLNASLQSYFT